MLWVFTNTPWWIFTNYPEEHDVFTFVFGCELVFYILGVGFIFGTFILIVINLATYLIAKQINTKIFNHLSLSLIPLGGASVFIGLFSLTITLLQKYANFGVTWISEFKAVLLFIATIWSLYLAYKIILQYTTSLIRKILGLISMFLAYTIINYSWILVLHIWTLKPDSIAWDTLWIKFFN
jgi:hypothetical protein